MALINEYFELTKKYQNDYGEQTILLMQVGSFFEVYGIFNKKTNTITGSRITDFSQICELNVVDKNTCVGKDNVMMAGFKDFQIEKYIKKIQDSGFTCVVYVQDEAAKNTTRSLAGIFSPGTYFSNESTNLTNNLTCIWIELINNKMLLKGKYVVVGVANIDIYTGKTSIFQFKETYINNPTTYDELERYISIYNPNEVIIISNLTESEVDDVINYTNIRCNSIHKINTSENNEKTGQFISRAKNCEKQNYQKEILNKFYKIDDYDVFVQNFYENNIATQAYCFLLDFVYQHNPNLVLKISEPIFENCSERLILANHSLKQLNVIDDYSYTGKYSSVLKMLNGCLTPMGKRKFAHMFLNPTTNITYLQREYDITDYMINKYEKYNDYLKTNLASIKDISKFERQVFLKKISPKMFYNLYQNIVLIREIYNKMINDKTIKEYLQIYESNILDIDEYCSNILTFINDNIEIPDYLINTIKKLFTSQQNLYVPHYETIIESIKRTIKPHESHECPFCKKAQVEARSTLQPKYRCKSCKKVFNKPTIRRKSEEFQIAKYAPGWVSVSDSPWFKQDWKLLSTTPKAQLSIQKLAVAEFEVFRSKFTNGDIAPFDCRDTHLKGGHRLGVARMRIGQNRFREELLHIFGNRCAMTGTNHPAALEAAHLYSYSTKGVHHLDGGILLRRDIHRLFDSGLIAIKPTTRKIHISPKLRSLDLYQELEGQSLKIDLNAGLMKWIDLHWKQHKNTWTKRTPQNAVLPLWP